MTSMQTVSAEFPLELDADATWERLSDLGQAHCYVPGLTALEFTTAQRRGVGTSRRVRRGDSLTLDETVEVWEEGRGFSLRLHRGDRGPIPPLRRHYFDYAMKQRNGQVWLVNRMRYEVGLGALGALLDRLLLRRLLARQLREVTLAQKRYYESGISGPASSGHF